MIEHLDIMAEFDESNANSAGENNQISTTEGDNLTENNQV